MPETSESEVPTTSQTTQKRNERTEAKFFEDVDKITAKSDRNTSGEHLDKLAYLDNDSLLNACISAKGYIKSKFKTTGQPYKNIAKTRFVLPSRLRRRS